VVERELHLKAQKQLAGQAFRGAGDERRQPRFKIQVEVKVYSRTCGILAGHSVDISESGISALLRIEVPLNEIVELHFTLPFGPVIIYAMVRQRDAFRYGFHFVESNYVKEVIRPTCRQLAVEQSIVGDL
jgi:hypothetical protein